MTKPAAQTLIVLRTVEALRDALAPARRAGEKVALVPTMGALHAGHLSLVEIAAKSARQIVVSVFVNPTQFAPHEDFGAYPRTEAADVEKLRGTPATIVFAPAVSEMYPPGHATSVSVTGPEAQDLETAFRPHFFTGVATVVTKLFLQAGPDVAVFGEKDYQQLLVVRRLVRDLRLPLEILGAPVLREGDGLALSSRNVYLSAAERRVAPALHKSLQDAAAAMRAGRPVAEAEAEAARAVLAAGFKKIDYITARDAQTLGPLTALDRPGRLLAAATLGATRLIDNIAV